MQQKKLNLFLDNNKEITTKKNLKVSTYLVTLYENKHTIEKSILEKKKKKINTNVLTKTAL